MHYNESTLNQGHSKIVDLSNCPFQGYKISDTLIRLQINRK